MLMNGKPSRWIIRIAVFTAIGAHAVINATAATCSASKIAFIDSVQEIFGTASVTTPNRTVELLSELRKTGNWLLPEPERLLPTICSLKNVAGSGCTMATNWTPSRLAPATDDILQINEDRTFTSTGVPTVAGTETGVAISDGALVISSDNGAVSADAITLSCSTANLRISDPGRVLGAGFGVTQVDANTVDVPIGSLSSILINTFGGNDTVNLNFTGVGCDFIPPGGLTFNGGDPTSGTGDKLNLIKGSRKTQTFNFTNEHDGSVVLDGKTIRYTGLEPISSSVNAANVVLNYSNVTETITATDAGGGQTTVDSNVGGEAVTFNNPSNTLTINGGDTGDDTINVNGLGSGFGASLTINGGTGNDVVNLNTNITFAPGNSLDIDLVNDNASPGVDSINVGTSASLQLSGAGTATLNASRNVTTASSSSVTTANGDVTITANPAGTTTGAFTGVSIAGTVEATGTGKVKVAGKGGDSGANQYGVFVNGGIIRGGSGSGLKTEVTGTGASNNTTSAHGIFVNDFSSITSNGGDVLVTGTGGAGSAAVDQLNYGVMVFGTNGVITSGGTGAVTVNGFGGTADNSNVGVIPHTGGTITSGGGGAVIVNGTGGPGVFGLGVEVFRNGKITSGGGTVNVTGTSASSDGVFLTTDVADALITSGGGAVTVTGVSNPGAFGILLNQATAGQSKISSGGNANITLIADKMLLNNGNTSVDAGLGTVTLRPLTNARGVDLGGADSATVLGLTDAELDKINGSSIFMGDTNSGVITVKAAITRPVRTFVVLTSGANINFSGGSIYSLGGSVILRPGTYAFPATGGSDVIIDSPARPTPSVSSGAASTFFIESGKGLKVDINGNTADSGYTQLSVAGQVNIDGVNLDLSGSTYSPVAGDSFMIVRNDSATAIGGTFLGLPQGFIFNNFLNSGLNAFISYTAGDGNDCVIAIPAQPPEISVSGRVLTAAGRGIRGATVTVTGPAGFARNVRTGNLGAYVVTGLMPSNTYDITATTRRFTFASPTLVITPSANVTNADLVASP